MIDAQRVLERLKLLPDSDISLFAVACAGRLAPVYRLLSARSDAVYETWIKTLLDEARDPTLETVAEVLRDINAAPEAREDDSHRPSYYAMRVLGVAAYAAQTIQEDSSFKPASWCCQASLSLLSDFDYERPEASVHLARAELVAQLESIDALKTGTYEPTIEHLLECDVAAAFEAEFARIAAGEGWEIGSEP